MKRIRKLAKKNRGAFSYVASHGKGSHGTVYYGARKAAIRDVKKELPTGTLMGTLKQLGIRKEDI